MSGPNGGASLTHLLEKWAKIGSARGWIEKWREGAIFPREMVFFLARCEEQGVRCIVESGRQDGFSTEVLAEYANDRRATVYSIDYEEDADRARRCRERLAPFSGLNLLRGDANKLLISTIRSNPETTAILMDGPKGFWAMALMFAASENSNVRVLSLHNLAEGEKARKYFQSFTPRPAFYEGFEPAGPEWRRFSEAEIAFCKRVGATRSLDASSLGVMVVDADVRARLLTAHGRSFKLYQPRFVRLGWKLGLDRLTSALFNISHRIPG